ncbi:hypothetical protein F5Y10DRAFT_271888 [Nemania abortiva]|nr:hypothetical protein F5Y10DRAFT_271888 [Nemania abortiva]
MRPNLLLFPALLASLPSSVICDDAAITALQAQSPSNDAPLTLATAEPDNRFATPPPTAGAEPLPAIRARQHIVAARTTSPVPTSITELPTSTSGGDGGDETGSSGGAENTSTTTVTITSRSTTTIRPTLTITSLFSAISPSTSGANGRLEPLLLLPWRFIHTLFAIFS